VKSPLKAQVKARCEGSFLIAQEKKVMDWFKMKRKWKTH